MPFGPIVTRELITAARGRASFSRRVTFSLLMLGSFWGLHKIYGLTMGHDLAVRQVALFGRIAFLVMVAIEGVVMLGVVPDMLARTIAGEKERKTLSAVLISPLSSGEIVFGKYAAHLYQYLMLSAVALPIMLILSLLGGIEPFEILVVHVAIFSTTLTISAVFLLCSAICRNTRRASVWGGVMLGSWLLAPLLLMVFGPFLPAAYRYIAPVVSWVGASSPFYVGLNRRLVGMLSGGRIGTWDDDFSRMLLLQAAISAFALAGAALCLRPVFRHQVDGELRGLWDRIRSWRWHRKRRPMGDDPILWKEISSRSRGWGWVFASIGTYFVLGLILYQTYILAVQAIPEVFANGYGPFAPVSARQELNKFVRITSAWLVSLLMISAACGTAVSLPSEREGDTWVSLLATPLSGREMLRGRWLAWFVNAKNSILFLLAFWAFAVVAGALHPLGFAALVILMAASQFFAAALGTWLSLFSGKSGNASGAALGSIILLVGMPPLLLMFPPTSSLFSLSFCIPFQVYLAAFSETEVRQMLTSTVPLFLSENGIRSAEGSGRMFLSMSLGAAFYFVSAYFLLQHAYARFDAVMGRPRRARLARTTAVKTPAPIARALPANLS